MLPQRFLQEHSKTRVSEKTDQDGTDDKGHILVLNTQVTYNLVRWGGREH
jgi:hypothetical protein